MKTYLPKADAVDRTWYVVDAEDQVLGRLASRVAHVLMGKSKPSYTDFLDTGDFVIVVNAGKVRLTGNKWNDKVYYRHSGRPGSLREVTAKEMLDKHPERLIRLAVKGMLPKNKLGSRMLKKLKVYTGSEHRHQAQQPQELPV
ncbi:MAG TPA: 50S ribosomal protein L13 [Acidobacteriota bacterium]|nr:50S ribosomal protein L13 [Acidobacteriota bacterium]